ncbi:MAG: hypothetical protein AVDCRST_MAG56-2220 [uncultured Cytophagales bacterium]|uniref:Uncharacterized protein n=1 Tax=uncultured Cytophagales bacterium TaxID=158755 RepID=A0A6J4IMV8_9SPHI|nr:MAG: hypothetical protein AVDCRST_MAG56-2220 [uncultured Cytophagales bacterium]
MTVSAFKVPVENLPGGGVRAGGAKRGCFGRISHISQK